LNHSTQATSIATAATASSPIDQSEDPNPVRSERVAHRSLRTMIKKAFRFGTPNETNPATKRMSLRSIIRPDKASAEDGSPKRSSLLSTLDFFNRDTTRGSSDVTGDTTHKKRRSLLRKKRGRESERIEHVLDLLSNDHQTGSEDGYVKSIHLPGQDRSPVLHGIISNPRVRPCQALGITNISHSHVDGASSTAAESERNTSTTTNATAATSITSMTDTEPSLFAAPVKGIPARRADSPFPDWTASTLSESVLGKKLEKIPEAPESPMRSGPANLLSEYNAIVDSMFQRFMLDDNDKDTNENKEAATSRDQVFEPLSISGESHKKTIDHVLRHNRSDSSIFGSIYEKYLAPAETPQITDFVRSVDISCCAINTSSLQQPGSAPSLYSLDI
jgi:hypothetical protein